MSVERAPNKWYVITGGPGSGKTSLVNELARRGYDTVKEAARAIIDEGLASGLTMEQIRGDSASFQERILRRKIRAESQLDPAAVTFLDRGIRETEVHLRNGGITPEQWIIDAVSTASYYRVFVLEQISEYKPDYARPETAATASRIGGLIRLAYETAGLSTITVPELSVEARADFVLDRL